MGVAQTEQHNVGFINIFLLQGVMSALKTCFGCLYFVNGHSENGVGYNFQAVAERVILIRKLFLRSCCFQSPVGKNFQYR